MWYSKNIPMDNPKCMLCLCWAWKIRKDGVDVTEKLLMLPWGKVLIENMIKKYKWVEAMRHFREKLKERKLAQ